MSYFLHHPRLNLLVACSLSAALSLAACSGTAAQQDNVPAEAETTEVASTEAEVTQADLEERLIGTWIIDDLDGSPAPTNEKSVVDVVSTDKAYVSAALDAHPEAGATWMDQSEADIVLSGDTMTLTTHPDEQTTVVSRFTITAIDDHESTASRETTITVDGNVVTTAEDVVRLVRVDADYDEAILGIWEGRCTSEGSDYDDGQEHRWQYADDGTYTFYMQDDEDWVPGGALTSEYFVAANLLCTRWVVDDTEYRECWEVTVDGDEMSWSALRENEDGTTYTATFEMVRVEG